VDGYGDRAASAIGSRANENVEVDELGVYGDGGIDVVGERMSRENWASTTDCLRA